MQKATAAELVGEAKRLCEVADARLVLLREGQALDAAACAEKATGDLQRLFGVLRELDRVILTAAVTAVERAQRVAAMLTPSPPPPPRCADEAPTERVPRMAAVVVEPGDVLHGSLADLIERAR